MISEFNEEDFNKLWSLDKEKSDYETAKVKVKMLINEKAKTIDGKPLTISLITERFQQYLKNYDREYGGQEVRFITKDKRRKNLVIYLKEKMYNTEYTLRNTDGRDFWLFENYTNDELNSKVKSFKSRINKSRSGIYE